MKQRRYSVDNRRRSCWDSETPSDKKTEYRCIKCCNWFNIDGIIFQDGNQYCRGCMVIIDSMDIQAWVDGRQECGLS